MRSETAPRQHLGKVERRNLRQALYSAIEWEDTLAQSHYVSYPKKFTGCEPKVVPPEYRAIVARCRRRIAAYKKLMEKLR